MAVDPNIRYKWSPIPCAEVLSTRQEWIDEDGSFNASVLLMCEWRRRWDLFIDLNTSLFIDQSTMGTQFMTSWTWPVEPQNKDVQPPSIDPDAANDLNKSIFRPRAYPDFYNSDLDAEDNPDPTYQKVGVNSTRFENPPEKYNTDIDVQVLGTKHAFIRVEYSLRYNIMEEIEYNTQYINTEKKFLQWASTRSGPPGQAGAAIDIESSPGVLETPSAQLHNQVLVRKIRGVSPKELASLVLCVGRTNQTAYDSVQFNRTFPPQSLLMMDPIVTQGINFEGAESTTPDEITFPTELLGNGYNVTLKFLFKEIEGIQQSEQDAFGPHNYFWRPDRLQYLASGTAGNPPVAGNEYGSWDRFRQALSSGTSTTFPFYRPFLPLGTVDRWLYSRPQLEPSLVPSV